MYLRPINIVTLIAFLAQSSLALAGPPNQKQSSARDERTFDLRQKEIEYQHEEKMRELDLREKALAQQKESDAERIKREKEMLELAKKADRRAESDAAAKKAAQEGNWISSSAHQNWMDLGNLIGVVGVGKLLWDLRIPLKSLGTKVITRVVTSGTAQVAANAATELAVGAGEAAAAASETALPALESASEALKGVGGKIVDVAAKPNLLLIIVMPPEMLRNLNGPQAAVITNRGEKPELLPDPSEKPAQPVETESGNARG